MENVWGLALTKSGTNFPGGSKTRVNRAGDAIRAGTATPDDADAIDAWRAAHRPVLNTIQAILRTRTRGTNIIVAQRHKRKRTIYDKLNRYPGMQLARMDDVAGCRLIFPDIPSLYEFRENLHKARFRHVLRNEKDKYDYIKNPKYSGYRGVHDVYSYDVNSVSGQPLKGFLIELQYRTIFQHAWATCVEVVGIITENQPKFDRGDDSYLEIFRYASEIIARAFEQRQSCLPNISNGDLVKGFLELDHKLNFLKMLEGLNAVDSDIMTKKNTILILSETDELRVESFRDAPDALRALFELEKEMPDSDIVLVKADSGEDVRQAFRNYFKDARDFIEIIEEGCELLSKEKFLYIDPDKL